MDRLTNKAVVASLVFDTIETTTFEQAERIAREVCAAFLIEPDDQWAGYQEVA